MTGRHESPPVGSAAREATAQPYIGKRRADDVLSRLRDEFPPYQTLPIEIDPVISRQQFEGVGGSQHIYRFANDYGASVVQGAHTYGGREGKWELAVVKFTGADSAVFDLAYDTPVTGDVIGWLSPDEVAALLVQIAGLR